MRGIVYKWKPRLAASLYAADSGCPRRWKKAAFACLCLGLCALLAGCGVFGGEAGEATPAPEETSAAAAPTATPRPTPKPTPVPVVSPGAYSYVKLNSKTLRVSFKYPSHWINEPGKSTASYVEPVNEGDVPARVAVTVKEVQKTPDNAMLREQFTAFIAAISQSFDSFTEGELNKKSKMMKRESLSMVYTAELNGTAVTGYVIMTAAPKLKRFYVYHFYSPTDDYDGFEYVMKSIRTSVSVL